MKFQGKNSQDAKKSKIENKQGIHITFKIVQPITGDEVESIFVQIMTVFFRNNCKKHKNVHAL